MVDGKVVRLQGAGLALLRRLHFRAKAISEAEAALRLQRAECVSSITMLLQETHHAAGVDIQDVAYDLVSGELWPVDTAEGREVLRAHGHEVRELTDDLEVSKPGEKIH